jgi:hypothetical protein
MAIMTPPSTLLVAFIEIRHAYDHFLSDSAFHRWDDLILDKVSEDANCCTSWHG